MRQYLKNTWLVIAIAVFAVISPQGVKAQDKTPQVAQPGVSNPDIDARLVEIIGRIKTRAKNAESQGLRGLQTLSQEELYADQRLAAAHEIYVSAFSGEPAKIKQSIENFKQIDSSSARPSLSRVATLFSEYADQLEAGATEQDLHAFIEPYTETGSWLEQLYAFYLSGWLYSSKNERQAALQNAQTAMALIPDQSTSTRYTQSARATMTSTIAQMHNLQGNTQLAISATLNYLNLTDGNKDVSADTDFVNNLIYSHNVSRDHDAALYLSEQLVEIEKLTSSDIPGLSEFRIAHTMNSLGRFDDGLSYSKAALSKLTHVVLRRQANVVKATSYAGLGRLKDARDVAALIELDLDPDHLLRHETSSSVLYLGFLLAQPEDNELATKLYNRDIDLRAQKFLANNSRDTTSMLASLENSRERQAEREAAAARVAAFQAMTIDRQKKLNNVLIILTLMLAMAALASFVFARYRGKMMKELEIKTEEAASAEKLKTEFLGMISHELRTPLNGIIGISDFLHNYHNDADIRKKTGIVLQSGNELLAVVESLTDMARLDAGQLNLMPENADVAAALNAIPERWSDKAQEQGLAFTHFIDPAITEHHVDHDRIIQCINILLANAISFTKKGRVHLHVTAETDQTGDVTGLKAIVADTGRGMTEMVQSRLFKPFMQADTTRKRNHMGTGLSLAIAYALAKMMEGDLTVVSREDRGSEFTLRVAMAAPKGALKQVQAIEAPETIEIETNLDEIIEATLEAPVTTIEASQDLPSESPILDTPSGPSAKMVDLMKPRGLLPSLHSVPELVLPEPSVGCQRILVVDDMESNRDILRLMLESQGHVCAEAADGQEALDVLEQRVFDLVILDIHMQGMDGVEMLEELRGSVKAYKNMPVVALTADNAASTNAACMEAGADLFLTKPVRQSELLKALRFLHQTERAERLA